MKKTYVILVEDYPAVQHYIYDGKYYDSEQDAFEEFPELLRNNLNLELEEELEFDDIVTLEAVDTFKGDRYYTEYSNGFIYIETDRGNIYITIEELEEKK